MLELEEAIAALRAEHSISAQGGDTASQNSTAGTEEQKQGWSGSTQSQLLADVSKAIAQVVRHNPWGQTWFE